MQLIELNGQIQKLRSGSVEHPQGFQFSSVPSQGVWNSFFEQFVIAGLTRTIYLQTAGYDMGFVH